MENPILTIAIPTYNRPEKVKKQVLSVVEQLTEEVCIVVIDNHSDIVVSSLFDEDIQNKVKFIRNRFNIGGDGNIAKCFDVCETEWLWTLSDDDGITNDAVKIVLEDIKNYSECIFINYNKDHSAVFTDFNVFLHGIGKDYSDLFWMSICIYNIRLLSPFMNQYYRAISSMQPGVVLLIKAMSGNQHNTLYLSSNTIVCTGGKEISWNRESFLYSTFFLFDYLRENASVLKSTLFSSISQMCRSTILQLYKNNHNYFFKAIKHHHCLMNRRGLWSSLVYDLSDILSFYAHLFYSAFIKK